MKSSPSKQYFEFKALATETSNRVNKANRTQIETRHSYLTLTFQLNNVDLIPVTTLSKKFWLLNLNVYKWDITYLET